MSANQIVSETPVADLSEKLATWLLRTSTDHTVANEMDKQALKVGLEGYLKDAATGAATDATTAELFNVILAEGGGASVVGGGSAALGAVAQTATDRLIRHLLRKTRANSDARKFTGSIAGGAVGAGVGVAATTFATAAVAEGTLAAGASAVLLASNPIGWGIALGAGVAAGTTGIIKLNQALDKKHLKCVDPKYPLRRGAFCYERCSDRGPEWFNLNLLSCGWCNSGWHRPGPGGLLCSKHGKLHHAHPHKRGKTTPKHPDHVRQSIPSPPAPMHFQ